MQDPGITYSYRKILIIPFDFLAHYLRCLEIAKCIRNKNTDIVFLKSAKYNQLILANGFSLTEQTCEGYSNVILKAGNFDFSWINEASVNITVNGLVDILEKEKPDMVIGDTYPGLNIACSFLKIKQIALINAYVTNYYAGFRDVPHNHRANRFRKYASHDQWEKVVRIIEEIKLKKAHHPFKSIRKNLNLEPGHNLFSEFAGDLNLIVDDFSIFPMADAPDHYIQSGPVLHSSLQTEALVMNFIEKNKHKACIFISSGSSGKNIVPDIIHHSELKDYNLIITRHDKEYQEDNAMFRSFVNFTHIADYIDLVICHGGNGTMYQALNEGKRIIAVPFIFEQEWNTQRFSELNLCKVFYPDENPEKLIRLIKGSLSETPGTRYQSCFENVPDIFRLKILDELKGDFT